jgi:hypothetical protein
MSYRLCNSRASSGAPSGECNRRGGMGRVGKSSTRGLGSELPRVERLPTRNIGILPVPRRAGETNQPLEWRARKGNLAPTQDRPHAHAQSAAAHLGVARHPLTSTTTDALPTGPCGCGGARSRTEARALSARGWHSFTVLLPRRARGRFRLVCRPRAIGAGSGRKKFGRARDLRELAATTKMTRLYGRAPERQTAR